MCDNMTQSFAWDGYYVTLPSRTRRSNNIIGNTEIKTQAPTSRIIAPTQRTPWPWSIRKKKRAETLATHNNLISSPPQIKINPIYELNANNIMGIETQNYRNLQFQ